MRKRLSRSSPSATTALPRRREEGAAGATLGPCRSRNFNGSVGGGGGGGGAEISVGQAWAWAVVAAEARSQTEDIAAGTLYSVSRALFSLSVWSWGFSTESSGGFWVADQHRQSQWACHGRNTKPDNAGGQQKDDEHGELFLLLHAPSGNRF